MLNNSIIRNCLCSSKVRLLTIQLCGQQKCNIGNMPLINVLNTKHYTKAEDFKLKNLKNDLLVRRLRNHTQ